MIFDFYCPAARMAVEIDGATHWDAEKRAKDAARDAWLARRGVVVMRVEAASVYRNLGAVAKAVVIRAEELIATR
jgi:very-short-patch-repair endonuclease